MAHQKSNFPPCDLFAGLSPAQCSELITNFEEELFPQGVKILTEGESTSDLWLIVSGKCDVTKRTVGSKEKRLAQLEAGSFFGELSFFKPGPHSATVTTLSEVSTLRLSGDRYRHLCEKNPAVAHSIAHAVANALVDRLRAMDEWICRLDSDSQLEHSQEWSEFRSKLYNNWKF